jgi:FMN phosphatase YigB (HAD superfamily)
VSAGPPRIVLFDLGGVVVRICRGWEEACVRAGVPVREPGLFHAPALSEARRRVVEAYQTGAIGCDEFWSRLSAASGGLYSVEEVRRVHLSWTMEDYPGVEGLIDRLHGAGLRTACLSNTNHAHWRVLRFGDDGASASRAVARLGAHLVSHELGAAKPGERIYRLAEERLGAGPGEIVFFDDLEENIVSARARGWRGERIDHEGDTAAQMERHLSALGVPLRG